MRKNYFPEKGFTLVEIIVAMGIGSILLIAIMQLTSTGNDAFKKSEARSKEQMDIRLAATHITQELRFAEFNEVNKFEESMFIKFDDPDPDPSDFGEKRKALYFGKYQDKNGEMKNSLIEVTDGKKRALINQEISFNENLDLSQSFFKWKVLEEGDIKKYGDLILFQIKEKEKGSNNEYSIDGNVRVLNASGKEIKDIDKKFKNKYRGIKFNYTPK